MDPTLELAGGNLTGPGTLTVNRAANWPSSAQLGLVASPMTTVIGPAATLAMSGTAFHPVGL